MTRGYLYVLIAASLWATIGLFMHVLHDTFGLSALTLAFLRAAVAFIIIFAILITFRRDLLQVSRRSLGLLALYGLVGISAFFFLYTQAIITTSVTTAVVLLYTAPAFVTLMAWRVWHEPLTSRKLFAVGLAFAGCALVARAYDPSELSLNALGVLVGIGAGLAYALFTMFNKAGQAHVAPWTLLVYELFFGALFLLPLQNPNDFQTLAQQPGAWIFILGLAIGPTLGSFTTFQRGLRTLPASNVSIVATLEPVLASGLAFFILGERLESWQLLGGGMVIVGALLLSLNADERK